MASPAGGPLVPCELGLHPNRSSNYAYVYQVGRNTPVLLCSSSTPACPPGYLLNTSGKELAKDCSTKRMGERVGRKTCCKKTSHTESKENDYKKPDF